MPAESTTLPHDLHHPAEFLPKETQLWPWLLAAAVVLLLVFFLVKKLKSTSLKKGENKPKTLAQNALQNLARQCENLPVAEVASQTSLIVRRYLEREFREPVLYETAEETSLRPQALSKLPAESRSEINQLLTRLANAKYAPSDPSPAHSQKLIQDALDTLEKLNPQPPAPPVHA